MKSMTSIHSNAPSIDEHHAFLTIFDNINSIVALIDGEGRMIRLNHYGQSFVGYTQEEVASVPYFWERFLPVSMHGKVKSIIENAQKGIIVDRFQNSWISRSGEERIFEWSNMLVQKSDGSMEYLATIGIDITEQEKQKLETQRQKEEFETIFNISRDGIAVLDLQTNFLEFNDAYLEMTGFSREELRTKSCIELSMPEDHDRAVTALNTVLEKGSLDYFEKRCRVKDDKVITISMSLALLPDKKRILISTKNITEQNAKNEQIKLDAIKLEIAAKSAEMGIWTWNFASDTLEWNKQMYSIYGIESQSQNNPYEMWLGALHPDDRAKAQSEVQYAAAFDGKFDTVFRILKHSSNEIAYIKASGICQFDKQGKKIAMIGTNIDITEQKLYEEKLNTAIKASREANKAKSEFLANMSHEIRTPLNGVIGLNNLMLNTNLTSTQKEYMTKAQQSSKALLSVINDILDYSKIEAGKLNFENRSFSIEEVLRSSSDLFEYSIAQKSLEFHIDIDPSIPLTLEGDPLRLGQIFNNLIGNAVKFTDQGDIIVRVKSLSKSTKEILLECSVSDSGIGISEQEQLRLFSPFSQSDASNTRKYGGTGLGLAISKQLSELMGGKIWLESTPGIGSTFYFTVKLRMRYGSEGRPHLSYLNHLRFLVVDDNELERELIGSMLQSWGALAIVCASGKEAIERMMSETFDYLIIDWKMPELDGLDVIKKVQQMSNGSFVNIIMVTAHVKEELHKAALDKQITLEKVLYKPVTPSVLLESIGDSGRLKPVKEPIHQRDFFVKGSVLVVEDNEINQLVIRDLLELFGATVEIAENGLIGIQKVKENQYDLVLMDLQMPVLDGISAARGIREFNKTVPIIALSAAVMEQDKKSTIESGMNGHLSKPIDLEELKEVLESYLVIETRDNGLIVPELSVEIIAGLDLSSLSQMLQPKQMEQFLRKFAENYKDFSLRLMECVPGDEAFKRLIHTLKGVSGNIGSKMVYEIAILIDESDNVELQSTMCGPLCEEVDRVIRSIENHFSSQQPILIQNNASIPEIGFAIESMIKRLEEKSFVDDDEIEACLSYMVSYSSTEILEKIREAVGKFEYESAVEHLKTIYGELHG
ncbi:MAG: response regulator [Sulfuricurvum sp.]|uniref:response regulator n=1 Tax=Sulfuricurvum sp. TaxID=2025608 RepID=UPI0026197CD6|nr:response regulator [Sulfuricurvum sp.]MDD2829730.1 response regulator [Sulfuricurvum sp.]MDD4949200.1 response regulator [Sulfuricurvum sp.]